MPADSPIGPSRVVVAWRVAWTLTTLVAGQAAVCGVSAAPLVLLWQWLLGVAGSDPIRQWALVSAILAPSYVLFAVTFMVVSPLAVRLFRWHTPPDAAMPIARLEWPLLRWVRYAASIHLARTC
jgi:hypothetical protein